MSAEPINFGVINQGEYRVLTFSFKQGVTTPGTGTLADPSGGAFVNLIPPGGVRTSYTASLTHASAGTYTLPFTGTIPGWWRGTAYAPAGSGQAAQPFQIEVERDDSYGAP